MRSQKLSSILKLDLLWLTALFAVMAALTGCAAGRIIPPSAHTGVALQGHVHGGQQPVAGAHVYLFAANTTGYGGQNLADSPLNASASLLNAIDTLHSDGTGAYVLTDAAGDFDISNDYTCNPGSQVYFYVHGGDAGGGTNSAIGLLAILGNCASGSFGSVPFIEINEVSTVAAAYSFAGYASDATHVSSNGSAQALTGIANAFATASNLVDIGTGAALTTTPAGNGTVPTATINTLANILASCVNTADNTRPTASHPGSAGRLTPRPHRPPYSSACLDLEAALTGANPNQFAGHNFNTATAAIFIAQNPGANVHSLYILPTPQAPFGPTLTSEPNNFTLGIQFSGGPVNFGGQLALDSDGNVWVPYQLSNGGNGAIMQFSNTGAPLSGSWTQGDIDHPVFVAIDTTGNAWISNLGTGGLLTEFSGSGVEMRTIADPTNPAYKLSIPTFDLSGNLWVTDGSSPGSLLEFSGTGVFTQAITGNGLSYPANSAFDAAGNFWVDNQQSHTIGKFLNGVAATNSPFSLTDTSQPQGVASDASGNLWVLKQSAAIDVLNSSGEEVSGAPYNSGFSGSASPHATFQLLDGAGNDWITTTTLDFSSLPPVTTQNLVELSSSGSLLTSGAGLALNLPFNPGGIAADSAGNLWVSAGNQLFEYVGLSTPIETPIAQALQDNCIAQRPCSSPE